MSWFFLTVFACSTATPLEDDKDASSDDDDDDDDDVIGDDDDDDEQQCRENFGSCTPDTTIDFATDSSPCTNAIISVFPEDGQSDAFYRTSIDALFQVQGDAKILVQDAVGNYVCGTQEWNGSRLVFTPHLPLNPDSDYEVTIAYECGEPTIEFTTGETGTAVPQGDVDGGTWEIDLSSGRFVKPEGVGPLLQQQMNFTMLLHAVDVDPDTCSADFRLAIAEENTSDQDLCSETNELAADWYSPYFEADLDSLDLVIEGFPIEYEQGVLSGAVAPDGSFVDGMVFAAVMDTRSMVPLVDPTGDPDTVCELVATFGVACVDCGGGQDFCLETHVDGIVADAVSGPVVPISAADVAAEPSCQ